MPDDEVLDSDDLFHLLSEVGRVDPADSTLPDTPLVRRTRARLESEVAEIKARGMVVDVPHEWPAPGGGTVTTGKAAAKDDITVIYDTFDPDNPPDLPPGPEPTEHEIEAAKLAVSRFWPPKTDQ